MCGYLARVRSSALGGIVTALAWTRAWADKPSVTIAAGAGTGFSLSLLAPGFWGFVGAFIYGGFELGVVLWGSDDNVTANVRKLEFSRYAIGLILGTASGQQFSLPLRSGFNSQ